MNRSTLAFLGTGSAVLSLGLVASVGLAQWGPGPAQASPMATVQDAGALSALSPASQNQVIGRYCLRCHNDDAKTGGLTLESFDVAQADQHAEVAEKMIRKLRAGMMPPPPARRPDDATVTALIAALAERVDEAAAGRPNYGGRTFQRLNHTEYERSILYLLGIAVDAEAFLPPDTASAGFDNIADVQSLSPTVMEGYLRAAGEISRLAVGDPDVTPDGTTYTVSRFTSQTGHVEGAPHGTRGGISVAHNFPADGEYVFTLVLRDDSFANLFGMVTLHDEEIEISIDGERVALQDVDRWMDAENETLRTEPIFVRAGPQKVSAAFLRKFDGPVVDVISPHDWSSVDRTIGHAYGITILPHLRDLVIAGPYNVTGVSATPSRQKIFSCRPTSPDEELPCAEEILSRLGAQAYRRALRSKDLEALVSFYEAGAAEGSFESGIRMALQAILASPHFVFRFERPIGGVESADQYRVSELALASRLSFFLWAAPPDDELIAQAQQGTLSDSVVLEQQVERMLRDPRSETLGTRFAAQWLRLQDLDKVHPDKARFPDFHQQLADAMRRETELFFNNLVRENRGVLELLTADYTFVNELLARHYGIPNVVGDHFRRVRLPEERRGLLGHGSILALTSQADRTSPVMRGKWIMEVLLGTPPPPPPPVPDLEQTAAAAEGRLLTVRERMERHRSDPVCMSCHRVIDPLGLALENFDATGAWRIRDNGAIIEASGELYDGSLLDGPSGLRRALLKYSDPFITTFTENLMAYGLGRRVEYYDMPVVRSIVAAAAGNNHRMVSFILGIVRSAAFQSNEQVELTRVAAEGIEGQ